MSKRAIAVISFGTTYLDTAEKTIHAVEREIAKSFPEYEIASAYTSSLIRSSLMQESVRVLSPSECLQQLLDDGYTDIVVLPTHILGGEEYSKVVECAREFSPKFSSIKVCRPLIEPQDVHTIVDTLLEVFTVPQENFLVFMGHGSNTHANEIYHLLNRELTERGIKNVYIATVEATPELVNAIEVVQQYHPTETILTPLMLVSGDHANNDMNEDWKSAFTEAKLNPRCILKGIGEYPEFRRVYVDRVREVLC